MGTQRIPEVNGDRVIRALRRDGWKVERIHGSHHILIHPDRPSVTIVVPVHPRPLKKGTLAGILQEAGLSIREFRELL